MLSSEAVQGCGDAGMEAAEAVIRAGMLQAAPARAAITRRERADGNAPWCAGPLAQPLPAPLRYQYLLEGVEVLDAFTRAEHD